MSGLFHYGKRNIERMQEQVPGSDYQALQHFISDSPWDAFAVLGEVARRTQTSLLAQGEGEVGLLLDESGWEKQGSHSVGVARQYCGQVGKVANAQVGVFAALVRGTDAGLVNARLYLPQEWTSVPARCARAGVPPEQQSYRSKPALAVELLADLQQQGLGAPAWVGGDALYGNSPELRHWLVAQQQAFVLDIGPSLHVYRQDPAPAVPAYRFGRPARRAVSAQEPVAVSALLAEWRAQPAARQPITYRLGSQAPLRRQAVLLPVWLWSAKTASAPQALWLLLSCLPDGSECKQSLCYVPGPAHAPLALELALRRQMQRYWIERAFQDAKQQLGLHEYQVRGWRGWYHHVALTLMALHFILDTRLRERQTIPLLSVPDIRQFMARTLANRLHEPDQLWNAMERRHQARQRDRNKTLDSS